MIQYFAFAASNKNHYELQERRKEEKKTNL